MTGENRRQNAAREMSRATEAIDDAMVLLDAFRWSAATTRAYFAAFHAVRALLYRLGLEVKSHAGVRQLLALHYVKPGILNVEDARLVSALARTREDADYAPDFKATEEMARADVEAAATFLRKAESLLDT